jgi:exopolyphosphatase/guanosine-5'-triphosphate,3'-diphosphate pyrophosphatase
MRIAVVDLGTNTFNLLVAEQQHDTMVIVHVSEAPVFLGKGGIERSIIAPEAFARGMEALGAHVAKAKGLGAEHITGFGTSALRNARNGADFVRRAKEMLDLEITVIPGVEEAALILDGVRLAVPFGKRPSLVMDIGGGSVEFMLATQQALLWKRSFELGVTRLLERFPPSDPMTMAEELRIAEHLDQQLAPLWSAMEQHRPVDLVGSSGSFDSLARIVSSERGQAIGPEQNSIDLTALEFSLLKDRLIRMTRTERLGVRGLPEHRVDTISYALILIEQVLAHDVDLVRWSRYALKEGAAWRALKEAHLSGSPRA